MPHEVVAVEWEGRPLEAFVPHPLYQVGRICSSVRLDAARAGVLSATAVQHDPPRLEVAARLLLRAEGLASSRIEAMTLRPSPSPSMLPWPMRFRSVLTTYCSRAGF